MKKRWIIAGLFLLFALSIAYYFLYRQYEEMGELKIGHPTSAIVVGKEDTRKHTTDPDRLVIYYRIENFNLSPSHIREQVLKAETEKYKRGEFRSEEKSKKWYDRTHVGDKLDVSYRWAGGGEIE